MKQEVKKRQALLTREGCGADEALDGGKGTIDKGTIEPIDPGPPSHVLADAQVILGDPDE